MRNFILPEGFNDERELRISGEQFHYLRRVLRLREGDELSGTDGKDRTYTLSVGEIRRDSLTLLVTGYQERSVDNCRISLMQCLPKGKGLENMSVHRSAEYKFVTTNNRKRVRRHDGVVTTQKKG